MHSTRPIHRVMILSDLDETQHYQMITADSVSGVISDFRVPVDTEDLDGPAAILNTCSKMFAQTAPEGTLITHRVPLYVLDDGNDAAHLADFIAQAKDAGWDAGKGAELGSGWLTFRRPGSASVHMGVMRMMDHTDTDAMIQPGDDLREIAERLSRYADLLGAPYRSTPGVSGLAALRTLWDRPKAVRRSGRIESVDRFQPRWLWGNIQTSPEHLAGVGDLHWSRPATIAERAMPYVVALDAYAAYLAAAAGAQLGHDAPTHTGAVMFDPTLSGFWRIVAGGQPWTWDSETVPVIPPGRIERDGTTWVTTPVLHYLSQTGQPMPEIVDSWLSQKSSRILGKWAEMIRDALPHAQTAGHPRLRKLIKLTYVEALALMGTPSGRVARADWAWTVRDEARIRLVRKIHKVHAATGVLPLKVKVDCAWYPSLNLDGWDWLEKFGQNPAKPPLIGHLKPDPEHCEPMADFIGREEQQAKERLIKQEARKAARRKAQQR